MQGYRSTKKQHVIIFPVQKKGGFIKAQGQGLWAKRAATTYDFNH